MTKRQLQIVIAVLGAAFLLGLSLWGWSKMGLAALQTGLGFC